MPVFRNFRNRRSASDCAPTGPVCLGLILVLGVLVLTGQVSADAPPLLQEGIRKLQSETDRWAFSQTQVTRDRSGQIKKQRIIRVDPSLKFEVRRVLISVDGRDPTNKERRKYQKEREKDRLRRQREGWQGKTIHDRINLKEARILSETDRSVVFQVPLVKNKEQRFPPEKFQLLFTINREQEEIEQVSVSLRESIRSALVARLDRGELVARFSKVEPAHIAPLTHLRAEGSGTVLFYRFGVTHEERRTDFRRVTPWDERFSVEFGELEFLGF